MQRAQCDVCGAAGDLTTLELCAGEGQMRRIRLCAEHARVARGGRPESLEQLQALFPEPGGRRSLLSRRGRLERRQLPPRPEGRRRGGGRRSDDARS